MKQMKRNRRQNRWKLLLAIMIAGLIVLSVDNHVLAESKSNGLGIIAGYDSSGTAVGGVADAAVMVKGGLVFTKESFMEHGDEVALYGMNIGGKPYEVQFFTVDKTTGTAVFQRQVDDIEIMETGISYSGQKAFLCYWGVKNESLEELSIPLIIKSYGKMEGEFESFYKLDIELAEEDVNRFNDTKGRLPGVIVSDEQEVLGIWLGDGSVIGFSVDESSFSGGNEPSGGEGAGGNEPSGGEGAGGNEPSGGEGAGGNEPSGVEGASGNEPSGGDETKGRGDDPEPETDPDPESEPEPDPEPKPKPTPVSPWMFVVGGIIVAIVGILAVLLVVLKKKNKVNAGPVQNPMVQPTAPVEDSVVQAAPTTFGSEVQPTTPLPANNQAAQTAPFILDDRALPKDFVAEAPEPLSLYLCCEGGAMDGRCYPVAADGFQIGRDPACSIRYPANTKGVSRKHCRLFWKNGVLMIIDLGSTSGTFIRGKGQIAANTPIAIKEGDTFYLGEKKNAFSLRMR